MTTTDLSRWGLLGVERGRSNRATDPDPETRASETREALLLASRGTHLSQKSHHSELAFKCGAAQSAGFPQDSWDTALRRNQDLGDLVVTRSPPYCWSWGGGGAAQGAGLDVRDG